MKIKQLLLFHASIALLLITFLSPCTQIYWERVDHAFFHLLNDPLANNRWLQYFWAFSNHKMADWVEDLVFLLLFTIYIMRPSHKTRTRKLSEALFCILLIGVIVFFVNRIFFREQVRILRDSPTLVIEGAVRLSSEIPWLSIKDSSTKSFPADHATTALLFACIYTFLTRNTFSWIAIAYCTYLSLPRMATGAHWLSDLLVGSGTIVLFFLSWVYCLPIEKKTVDYIERFLMLFQRKDNISIN